MVMRVPPVMVQPGKNAMNVLMTNFKFWGVKGLYISGAVSSHFELFS